MTNIIVKSISLNILNHKLNYFDFVKFVFSFAYYEHKIDSCIAEN